MTKPFGILEDISCDTIAECYGVSDKAYKELWGMMSDAKPLRELIDIENSCPNDALGLNTPAKFWEKFSWTVKEELIALANKADDEFLAWKSKNGF
jgi:hypothetical protein